MKKTKFNKESRNLLIALLLGDGTICKSSGGSLSMKIHQGRKQREYTEWKIKQMDECGISNSGLKIYYNKTNCTHGEKWENYACYIHSNPFVHVLRRVIYKESGKVFSRKLLNRLDTKGLAIWYMDDGNLNFKRHTNKDGEKKIHGLMLRLSTCVPKDVAQIYADFFKEKWNINFYLFHEGKKEDSYSLRCGTNEAIKFINLVKPYVNQIPSMRYKIEYDLSHRLKLPIGCTPELEETHDTQMREDIVLPQLRDWV